MTRRGRHQDGLRDELATGLAAERAALAGRLRARGRPEADIARRVDGLRHVQAGEAAVYGYPDLADELLGGAARAGPCRPVTSTPAPAPGNIASAGRCACT